MNTCVFYFNIKGSFNDPSNIYLIVFVNDKTENRNTFLILKNNEWIDEFPNKNKLMFPKNDCLFYRFGCDFMVIYLFFNVFLCKKVTCENAKIKRKHNQQKSNKYKNKTKIRQKVQ